MLGKQIGFLTKSIVQDLAKYWHTYNPGAGRAYNLYEVSSEQFNSGFR